MRRPSTPVNSALRLLLGSLTFVLAECDRQHVSIEKDSNVRAQKAWRDAYDSGTEHSWFSVTLGLAFRRRTFETRAMKQHRLLALGPPTHGELWHAPSLVNRHTGRSCR